MVDEIHKNIIISHEWQQRSMKLNDKTVINGFAKKYTDLLFPPEYFPNTTILTTRIITYLKTKINITYGDSHYKQIFDFVHSNIKGTEIIPNYLQNLTKLRTQILQPYLRVHINKTMPRNDFTNKIGYKDPYKRAVLNKANYGQYQYEGEKSFTKNKFPLKENRKNYSLHTIAPKDTYMMDLMFDNHNEYCYLVLINVNTRKLYVQQTNIEKDEKDDSSKTAPKVKAALEAINRQIHSKNKTIKYLKGDDEGAFKSHLVQNYYRRYGIKFLPARREILTNSTNTKVKQTSLNIIDRVIRTIRDLAYNMNLNIIRPEDMENIVWQYNNAPHKTLSKYAGQSVSPDEVDSNPELELFIVKRIAEENYKIMTKPNYFINIGEPVKIYNERYPNVKRRSEIEPGNWYVHSYSGPLFKLRTRDGHEKIKSRYQIDYM